MYLVVNMRPSKSLWVGTVFEFLYGSYRYVSALIVFVVTLTIQYYYCIVAIYTTCVVTTSLAYEQD